MLALWSAPTLADNWPAWSGPNGLGTSAEKNLPLKWSPTENVRWKVQLPSAENSTPIIWGDRAFITQANDVTAWPPKVSQNFAGGSPVHAAGRIYVRDRRGATHVFAAGLKDEHLATNPLNEHKDASIAIAHGDIIIRTHKHLWRIGQKK